MRSVANLTLAPGKSERELYALAAKKLGVRPGEIEELQIKRRSLDARRKGLVGQRPGRQGDDVAAGAQAGLGNLLERVGRGGLHHIVGIVGQQLGQRLADAPAAPAGKPLGGLPVAIEEKCHDVVVRQVLLHPLRNQAAQISAANQADGFHGGDAPFSFVASSIPCREGEGKEKGFFSGLENFERELAEHCIIVYNRKK